MACYCPHIRCFDCNNYGHIAVDCPDKIPPSVIPARSGTTTLVGMTDQHLRVITTPGITTVTIGIGTGPIDLNLTPITLDTGVKVTVILTKVTLDPFTSPHAVAHHTTEAQAHTATARTHHTTYPHHTGVSPEMTVDPEHANPTNTTTNPQKTIFQFTSNTLEAQR